jgi:DNA-binding PadR family transcriptional regulator
MVARMTEKGLLSRQKSATDARANTVALTPQGRAVLEAVRPKVMSADLQILDRLPAAKREGFMKLLHALVEPGATTEPAKPSSTVPKLEKPKKQKLAKADKPKGDKKKKKKLKKALVGGAN